MYWGCMRTRVIRRLRLMSGVVRGLGSRTWEIRGLKLRTGIIRGLGLSRLKYTTGVKR
jgi:hypothetical protein